MSYLERRSNSLEIEDPSYLSRDSQTLARFHGTLSSDVRLNYACAHLGHKLPSSSAVGGMTLAQGVFAVCALAGLVYAALFFGKGLVSALSVVLVVVFLSVVLLRSFALYAVMTQANADVFEFGAKLPSKTWSGGQFDAAQAPVYTVLVPLFDEAEVLPQLCNALRDLDYPKQKLDVIFICEADDDLTKTALSRCNLESYMRVISVPPGQPRTKPRALNYAMTYALGDYVVVYDAEDIPEQDQLYKAVQKFRNSGSNVACLQARLLTYNAGKSWFAQQFSIEYATLFLAILPTLQRLGLPIPLGGTSNHFRRDVLDRVGLWDVYNVTEDADLGMRLYRRGWRTEMLCSTTWEEAPLTWRVWLAQRTRWLKGWMQTYLVHMRQPLQLLKDLGLWKFVGFHLVMGVPLLSAFAHVTFYVLLALIAVWPDALGGISGTFVFWFGVGNFLLALGVTTLLSVTALGRYDLSVLKRAVIWLPVYWLAISIAAYRALYQIQKRPFVWEKTPHFGL